MEIRYCEYCGVELKPAPASFDGIPAYVGYLPCDCKETTIHHSDQVICNKANACTYECPHKIPHKFVFGECNYAVCDDFGDYACCINEIRGE